MTPESHITPDMRRRVRIASTSPSGACPQVLGGVGAPRTPLFGSSEKLACARPQAFRPSHGAHEADIGCRKSVRLTQLTHRDVLGRPFAYSRQCAQLRDGLLKTPPGSEDMRVGDDRRGDGRQSNGAPQGHTEGR